MNRQKLFQYILILLIACLPVFASAQVNDPSDLALAGRYYQDRQFDKAADIYFKMYTNTMQPAYFKMFLNCLIEQPDYERAEKAIQKELRGKLSRPELFVQLGYLKKLQKNLKEAYQDYDEAINRVGNSKINYSSLANEFLGYGEYEYAEKLYQKGKTVMPDENFHYELARVYLLQRNHQLMLREYLDLLKISESHLINVQNGIQSALSMDVDGSLKDLFRNKLLEKIQQEPNLIVYNRLMIWYFVQEKNFTAALRQSIALDKRTGTEEQYILNLAGIAGQNKEYDAAINAFQYLYERSKDSDVFPEIVKARMQMFYLRFMEFGDKNMLDAQRIKQEFETSFELIEQIENKYSLIIDYAHLLAFYLDQSDKAIELLQELLNTVGLNLLQKSEVKIELADIMVYNGKEWDAILLYSQVVEGNKKNSLGDEAKLKKARLSYFLGDFNWAKAQLDVIKASTSKLTSNDAFQLSLLIGNNLNLDTTSVPMKMFARADFYSFRNQDSLAVLVLDSIQNKFGSNSLMDEVLYRKAEISRKKGDMEQAASYYKEISQNYSYGLLADDALFMLAELYQYHLNKKEEAMALYKEMLLKHPGSIYVIESRERFRYLRGDAVSTEPTEVGVN